MDKKEYQKKYKIIKDKGKLSCSDDIEFERVQVANDIFNMGYKGNSFQKAGLPVPRGEKLSKEMLWLPKLTHKDWENTVLNDGNTIHSKYKGNNKKQKIHTDFDENIKVYTFAQHTGERLYKFIGVFKCIKRENLTWTYEKISDELKLPI